MSSRAAAGDLTYILGLLSAVLIVLNGFLILIGTLFASVGLAIHRVSFDFIVLTGVTGVIFALIAMFCGATIFGITDRMRRTNRDHFVNGFIIMLLSLVAIIGGGGFVIGTLFGLIAGFIILIR
jgi:hypothetical protein